MVSFASAWSTGRLDAWFSEPLPCGFSAHVWYPRREINTFARGARSCVYFLFQIKRRHQAKKKAEKNRVVHLVSASYTGRVSHITFRVIFIHTDVFCSPYHINHKNRATNYPHKGTQTSDKSHVA
jgi:hypothetical protein